MKIEIVLIHAQTGANSRSFSNIKLYFLYHQHHQHIINMRESLLIRYLP